MCYNQSLQTFVDEINTDDHMKMKYNEFVEGFARVCDKASHAPIIPKRSNL